MNLVSEFFYDGVRRIIPGLIFIGFYWSNVPCDIMERFGIDSSVYVLIGCIFILAWPVGFAIEQVTTFMASLLFKCAKVENIYNGIRDYFYRQKKIMIRTLIRQLNKLFYELTA